MKAKKVKALVLLSGGLDSRLACEILQEQLRKNVEALFFLLPFGGGCCSDKYCVFRFCQKQGIKLYITDLTKGKLFEEYINLIKKPKFSRGIALNPCIDCHIFMLKKAEELAEKLETSKLQESKILDSSQNSKRILKSKDFDGTQKLEISDEKNKAKYIIATGEVLNERPLSQTKKAFSKIDKELGFEILRPLSAKLLPETSYEKNKLVDRSKLLDIQGRSRKRQIELAKKFNIDFPSPAGGCLLCEKEYCKKLLHILNKKDLTFNGIKLLSIGRHFLASQIILGRNEKENKILEQEKGIKIIPKQPGGTALVRCDKSEDKEKLIEEAKKLIKKYTKHKLMEFDVGR